MLRSAEIVVTNASGAVVRRQTVTLGSGATSWMWDGKNTAGATQPDGAYRIQVSGRDANGTAVAVSHTVRGTLTGAQRTDDGLTLSMGALSLGFDALRNIVPES